MVVRCLQVRISVLDIPGDGSAAGLLDLLARWIEIIAAVGHIVRRISLSRRRRLHCIRVRFRPRGLGFRTDERDTIRMWDLIIVRMDLAECEESVSISAVVDKRRL
jgi:hypothetical protein